MSRCSLDVHLETLLAETNIPKPDLRSRSNIELSDSYWDNRLSPEEIFRELETQIGGGLSGGFATSVEEQQHQVMVKSVILAQIGPLVDHLYEWAKAIQTSRERRTKQSHQCEELPNRSLFLSSKSSTSSWSVSEEESVRAKIIEPNQLRQFAHLVICLRQLHLLDPSDQHRAQLYVEILEAYIGFLIEYKLIELVAFYAGYLPEIRQVAMLANLFETIDDQSDRKMCLMVAKKTAKLNLAAVTALVVENIRLNKAAHQSTMSKSLSASAASPSTESGRKSTLLLPAVTADDRRKIHALDWLLLDDQRPQYLELLWQTNALVRVFLLEQKSEPAAEAFHKLPADIVNRAFHEWKRSPDYSSAFDFENVVREYFCHKAYFEAMEAFQKW